MIYLTNQLMIDDLASASVEMQFVLYWYLIFHLSLSSGNSSDLNFTSGFISKHMP